MIDHSLTDLAEAELMLQMSKETLRTPPHHERQTKSQSRISFENDCEGFPEQLQTKRIEYLSSRKK